MYNNRCTKLDPDTYISPNLRTTVYKYGMQGTGDWKTWSAMFTRYLLSCHPKKSSGEVVTPRLTSDRDSKVCVRGGGLIKSKFSKIY